jgi:hypothetical protein
MSSVASTGPVVSEGKTALVAGKITRGGTVTGYGFTATVGLYHTYTIVFDKKYKNLIACYPGVERATAGDFNPQIASYTASTKTLVIKILQAGTATDPGSGGALHFIAVMERY